MQRKISFTFFVSLIAVLIAGCSPEPKEEVVNGVNIQECGKYLYGGTAYRIIIGGEVGVDKIFNGNIEVYSIDGDKKVSEEEKAAMQSGINQYMDCVALFFHDDSKKVTP